MEYTTTYHYSGTPEIAVLGAGILGAVFAFYMVILFTTIVLNIIAEWRIFVKAGEKGWKSLIPIYNIVTLYKIVGLSPWLLLLGLIPFVGWIAIAVLTIICMIKLGEVFGKSAGFIVGLVLLGIVFKLILAFDKSEYIKPKKDEPEII